MTKKSTPQMQIPLNGSNRESLIIGAATLVLRNSAARAQMCEQTRQSHEVIEGQLAEGRARQGIVNAACAYLVEQLPAVIEKLVAVALDGNPAACKTVLELAGFEEQVKRMVSDSDAQNLPPLEQGMLESLREQIARMPDTPDPLDEP